MTIVMGLDQHRAQITAEWIDTETGEVGRTRVRPADRAGVRRFLGRFGGRRLEVALEATTGWRFVVGELRAIGAQVHLAEPAETAARRGRKKRPKTDRADVRHLRELLMVDRLPESWIPPEHILDLRARVRLRHTLVDQRGEWQIARRVTQLLQHHVAAPAVQRLVSAAEIAKRFDVSRQWVYENADRLGAVRLGRGARPRLRFDPQQVEKQLNSAQERASPRPRGAPDDGGWVDQADLIPIRRL